MLAPEGRRRRKNSNPDSPNIIPFKKGPFHLAKLTQKQIVPIVIVGSSRIAKADNFTPSPGCIYIKVCDPIGVDVINSKSVDELVEFTHQRFLDESQPRSDEEIFGDSYDGWGYFLGYLSVNLSLIWLCFF